MAPGSPPDDSVRGLVPCFIPPRMLQSGASFYRILSVASDAPVRGTGFTPGPSSPGASAVLHSAPDAPFRGFFLSYSLRCLGRSSPWHRVHPRTNQSPVLHSAPDAPIRAFFCCNLSVARTLQSMAPASPPDHPVRGLVPCFIPPRMLQSGAVVFSPLPRTLQSMAPGAPPADPVRGLVPCFIPPRMLPGRLFIAFSQLPRTLQSVAPFSPPDDPVRGLVPCFIPPRMLQSGASFYCIPSVASDAPVRGTGFIPGRSSPGASAVLHSAPGAPIRGVFLSYSLRCLGPSSPWHRVHPRTIQSGG